MFTKKLIAFAVLCALFLTPTLSFAGKDNNTLKAGVSYVWLSDYDSQGMMFSNSFNHYLSNRLSLGLNLGMLSASRYDKVEELFSIKNTFYMGSLEASFDLLRNESIAFRIGGGGAARHRAEINSNAEDEGTLDGKVMHIKTSDFGFNGYIENDFSILKNGVAGGRIGYYYYTKGTPVLSIGMHIGFTF